MFVHLEDGKSDGEIIPVPKVDGLLMSSDDHAAGSHASLHDGGPESDDAPTPPC